MSVDRSLPYDLFVLPPFFQAIEDNAEEELDGFAPLLDDEEFIFVTV